jgi:polyisoprenoid-binding protein YceI
MTRILLFVAATCVLFAGSAGTAIAADTFSIDKSHSSILFAVKHMVITKVKGEFTEYAGTILYDASDVSKSSVEVTIKTASIDTKDEKRDDHLRNPDFFDTETYPEITFKSKAISKSEKGFVATGDLTMRGVTKEIEIPFEITGVIDDPWGNTRMGVAAELELNRQDYGISWSKSLDAGGLVVGDNVEIEIEIEAIKAK